MLFSIELDGTYIWFKWFGGTVFEGTTFDRSTFLKELWINKTERTGQLACRLADEMQDEWWITTQLSSQLKSSDIKWYYQLKNGLSLVKEKPSYEAIKWRFSVDDQWWWSDFKHTRGWSFDEHLENWDGHKTNLIRINSNNFISTMWRIFTDISKNFWPKTKSWFFRLIWWKWSENQLSFIWFSNFSVQSAVYITLYIVHQ